MTGSKDVLGPRGTVRWMEMRWPWDADGGLVRRKLLHRHTLTTVSACLSLLPLRAWRSTAVCTCLLPPGPPPNGTGVYPSRGSGSLASSVNRFLEMGSLVLSI